MPLCKWHTFWMAPCLNCYFIVILFYIERKWLFMRNLARILPLKSKLSGKFQRFNAIKYEFPKISIKMINCKAFYKAQTASCLKGNHSSFPSLRLWNKNFLTEINRNIRTFTFKVLQGCTSWASRNGAVQMFFLTTNRNMFALLENL